MLLGGFALPALLLLLAGCGAFAPQVAPTTGPGWNPGWECGMCRITNIWQPAPGAKYPCHRIKVGQKMECGACSRAIVLLRGVARGGINHTCPIYPGDPPECCLDFLGAPLTGKIIAPGSGRTAR